MKRIEEIEPIKKTTISISIRTMRYEVNQYDTIKMSKDKIFLESVTLEYLFLSAISLIYCITNWCYI